MWKGIGETDRPQMTVQCDACVLYAVQTHSVYAILAVFKWQKWLSEGASLLCYMYFAAFVVIVLNSDVLTFENFIRM
jgi:hypothetical protein